MSQDIAWLIKNGDLEQVRQVVTSSNVNLSLDQPMSSVTTGRRPLHVAADYGQTEIAEYLISLGADVNIVDVHRITPLLAAVFEGHTETVRVLVKAGAQTNVLAPDGSSYAECSDKPEIKQLLNLQNCC